MENKTRFDLNKALQDWKAELATRPGIDAENIRELATHLFESINAFKKNGCSDEEAFSKARQKLGSVQQLGAEFAKENLLKVWHDRVFWITVFPLVLLLICLLTDQLFENLACTVNSALGLSQSSIVLALLDTTPPLLLAIAMATGFAQFIFRRLHWIIADRWRFAATGVIAILGAASVAARNPSLWPAMTAMTIFAFGLLAFAVLIWPRELAIALPAIPLSSIHRRTSITLCRERLFWTVIGYLAINVWGLVPVMGYHEIVRIKGETAVAHLWFPIAYLSVWFLPMAAVGIMLASAHLSALARWLRTRSRVGLFTSALSLILICQLLWIWRWGVRPDYLSDADWKLQMQRTLFDAIILVPGLIAITLWAMPARSGQLSDDRFRYA
jgi:hypothetical protein